MADEIIYDSTGLPVEGTDSSTEDGGDSAFSFTTNTTSPGTLTDVKVGLEDASAATDGGSVTFSLYSNNPDRTVPDVDLADLETISDSQLSSTGANLVDVPVTTGVPLDANTRYWIEVTGSAGAQVGIEYAKEGEAGTGTSSEYYDDDNGNPYPNADGALIGQVTENVVCFATGTLVRSCRGDVLLETLEVGDLVVTASGEHRPIRWLGHRTIDCSAHSEPCKAWPIRIAAGAFGEAKPSRDLFVSPAHAICVDVVGEVLIPAIALVNGATIQQVEVDEITYWHVELDSHDIVFAEGLPAESYLDCGNRAFFVENDMVVLTAGPDGTPNATEDYCRPFHADGALVEAVRAQLHARAIKLGWRLSDELDPRLEVDGQWLAPVLRGLTARFHVPSSATDVWLVSPCARPCDTEGEPDRRALGLCVRSLRIEDGLAAPREIALDDPLLGIGFHDLEAGARRWTSGRARLPARLWEGYEDGFYLRVELAGPPVPRWTAPRLGEAAAERPRLALVA